jgi:hypothetical protein
MPVRHTGSAEFESLDAHHFLSLCGGGEAVVTRTLVGRRERRTRTRDLETRGMARIAVWTARKPICPKTGIAAVARGPQNLFQGSMV